MFMIIYISVSLEILTFKWTSGHLASYVNYEHISCYSMNFSFCKCLYEKNLWNLFKKLFRYNELTQQEKISAELAKL